MPSPVAGVLDTKGNVAQAVSYMNSQSGNMHSSSRQEGVERESAKEQFLLPQAREQQAKGKCLEEVGRGAEGERGLGHIPKVPGQPG